MEDWTNRIDKYLLSDNLDVLKNASKISHKKQELKSCFFLFIHLLPVPCLSLV